MGIFKGDGNSWNEDWIGLLWCHFIQKGEHRTGDGQLQIDFVLILADSREMSCSCPSLFIRIDKAENLTFSWWVLSSSRIVMSPIYRTRSYEKRSLQKKSNAWFSSISHDGTWHVAFVLPGNCIPLSSYSTYSTATILANVSTTIKRHHTLMCLP